MSPQTISDRTLESPVPLREDDTIRAAVGRLLKEGYPALPVTSAAGKLVGIFGEREFMRALFPAYFDGLRSARFVTRSLDSALENRLQCADEPVSRWMNIEHVEISADASDAHIAETFLHHRGLILPVIDGGAVIGMITRRDYFTELARRFEALG